MYLGNLQPRQENEGIGLRVEEMEVINLGTVKEEEKWQRGALQRHKKEKPEG